ncbi:hypothetical protein KUCAC02_007324 [Chaenocephalus aceratus]|uniref:Uncharacterized protein n=1 Tax=Chaenocephalus aceratus TaxID=36190 RepID=A0ACB9X559_CHAAC|nr:hypothetical protein KUCAC02_007324 [Chaenocephalus aceratus]
MMDLFRRGELGLLGGERDWPWLPPIMISKPGWPVWRGENSSIKRKLKHYEVKFPIIKTTNLQQRINSLTQETSLAEQHVEQICGLESALRQRETSLQKLSVQLRSKDAHKSHLQLHASLDVPREGRGGPLQSSRSLDALSDLKLQRLEAELEGARHREEGACHREGELRAELKRLQKEVAKLQEAQRQVQEPPPHCEHCDVEWIKKAGDEHLAVKQSDLLRNVSQEPLNRPSPAPQRLSPTSPQRPHSPLTGSTPPLPSSLPIRRPRLLLHQPTCSRLRAKFQGRRSYSEVSDPSGLRGPGLADEGSGVNTPKAQDPPGGEAELWQNKPQLRTSFGACLSSSPHHCPLDLGFPLAAEVRLPGTYSVPTVQCCTPLTEEVHHFCRHDNPPEPTPLVTPPQSSDDEEDVCTYLSPAASPPRTLGAIGIGSLSPREQPLHPSFSSPRKQPRHPSFSSPEGPSTLSCHLPPYMNTEHAQSWPSINLWMESEESAARSCPLCQLTFPTGYPDDALIKHIDSHLENSKI